MNIYCISKSKKDEKYILFKLEKEECGFVWRWEDCTYNIEKFIITFNHPIYMVDRAIPFCDEHRPQSNFLESDLHYENIRS